MLTPVTEGDPHISLVPTLLDVPVPLQRLQGIVSRLSSRWQIARDY